MLICGRLEGRVRGREGGGPELGRSVTAWEGRRGRVEWSEALWIAIACFNLLVGLSVLVYPAANDQVPHFANQAATP